MTSRTSTVKMVGVFASLNDAEVEQVASLLLERRFRRGEVVFEQGEEADALYVVESGRLKATARDTKGREHVLALYSQGDFFGEMALLSGQARSATISAVTDSVLMVLRKEDFETFVLSNIRVMRLMLDIISQHQTQNAALLARRQLEDTAATGKVITICSPKGGVGRTTIAVNLAVALKEATGKRVALVDGSLGVGGVATLLGLVPDRSTAQLLPQINQLDHAMVEKVTYSHTSGIRVLLAPAQPDYQQVLTGYHINIILTRLREKYDYIVVDASAALEDSILSILRTSDLILMLTTIETAALNAVKAFINTASALSLERSGICLVANRADSTGGMSMAEAESIVGHKFLAGIVSDGMLATNAGNKGVPIVLFDRNSRLAADLRGLANATLASLEGKSEVSKTAERSLKRRKRSFGARAAGLRLQSIFQGLGFMFTGTISLLFVNNAFGPSLQSSLPSYPQATVTGVLVGASVLVGSFLALRLSPGQRGWSLGLILGLLYGLLSAMITSAIADLAAGETIVSLDTVVLAIPVYGVLGLVGGIIGSIGR